MSIFVKRDHFKPFEYPQFYTYFDLQQKAHWLPGEVPMADDVMDYKSRLVEGEKFLIDRVLRKFTQSDIEVMNNYNQSLIPYFPHPEITMMLSSFAAFESIHVQAYAHLNDTLGLPEEEYQAFKGVKEIADQFDLVHSYQYDSIDTATDEGKFQLLKNLAVFGAFMEGVALFSSFAMLMHFPRVGKLKGVGQIVTWSIRDESLHCDGISALFKACIAEFGTIDKVRLATEIRDACEKIVQLEHNFIDYCFADNEIDGLHKEKVKDYVKYIANYRLAGIGFPKLYEGVDEHPLNWLTLMIAGKEHANFFETRATEYAKASIIDNWHEIEAIPYG